MPEQRAWRAPGVWWMHPGIALPLSCFIVVSAAYMIPQEVYALYWKTGKFIDLSCYLTALGCILAFAAGAILTPVRRNATKEPVVAIPWDRVRTLMTWSYLLCVLGYVFWAIFAIKNGISLQLLKDQLSGTGTATYAIKEQYLVPVTGITSLTQFGVATVALAVPLGIAQGWKSIRGKLFTVFFLAFVRAFVNSERLAVIELAIPCLVAVVLMRTLLGKASARERRLTALGPVVGGGLLYLLFSAFEHSRSWVYYSAQESNFWRFSALRLVGYYSTAINNGSLIVRNILHPSGIPYFSLSFVWKFPLVKDVVEAMFPTVTFTQQTVMDLFASAANPEFNNPSGIFLPVVDFGVFGGILYWLIAGLVCGVLYKEAQRGAITGLLLYPVLFTQMIEASRIMYWTDGRFFPPLFLLLVGLIYLLPSRMAQSQLRLMNPLPVLRSVLVSRPLRLTQVAQPASNTQVDR